jgi:hypothetical protein
MADPSQGAPGISPHPRDDALPHQCAETQQTGPGRPPGSRNRRPAARHNIGKNQNKVTPADSDTKIRS